MHVGIQDARRLVFRVASDPELMARLYRIAERSLWDPAACQELERIVRSLEANASVTDRRNLRDQLMESDLATHQAADPYLQADAVRQLATSQGMVEDQWLRRAAFAAANICKG